MTFEEAKELLQDIRHAKRRARQINLQIEEYISIHSSLNNPIGRSKGCVHSPVEAVVLRVEKERESLAKALQVSFDLEDKLSEALDTLSPVERDIIVGCYMRATTNLRLASEFGYEERQIRRIKNKAIHKISKRF